MGRNSDTTYKTSFWIPPNPAWLRDAVIFSDTLSYRSAPTSTLSQTVFRCLQCARSKRKNRISIRFEVMIHPTVNPTRPTTRRTGRPINHPTNRPTKSWCYVLQEWPPFSLPPYATQQSSESLCITSKLGKKRKI